MSMVTPVRRRFSVATLVASLLVPPLVAAAQEKQTNPFIGDPKAIEQGRSVYRGRCAVCHGMDAKGYRGPDLTTGDWIHGGSDVQLFQTIKAGVPGTEMPGNGNMLEDEVWRTLAYLRSLTVPGTSSERGNAARGEEIFWAKNQGNCGQCHMIDNRGGRLGPNLSRIGASRSVAALEREIRRPAEFIQAGFETVTVVTRDGRKIRGARKNEDTFSVQVMTANEDIMSFFKRDVTDVVPESQSLMPAYGPERLAPDDLDDLVRYLRTLKGRPPASQD